MTGMDLTREYDPTQPLFFIHVPKCAGTSTKEIFKGWFDTRLLQHYYDERSGTLPPKRDLDRLTKEGAPPVIYGHFNRIRGFGIEDYYPNAVQFVSILRDPFELALSTYFYIRKHGKGWKDLSRYPKDDLFDYVTGTPLNMLNHFPREVTYANYKEQIERWFIEIGVVENLEGSIKAIAKKIHRDPATVEIGHLNATPREIEVPCDLRDKLWECFPLEHAVYDYAAERHGVKRPQ